MIYGLILGVGLALVGAVIIVIGAIHDIKCSTKHLDEIIQEAKEVTTNLEVCFSQYRNKDNSKNTCMNILRHKTILLNNIDYLESIREAIANDSLNIELEQSELENILDNIRSAKEYLSYL